MASKWKGIKDKFPAAIADSSYQEKIDVAKHENVAVVVDGEFRGIALNKMNRAQLTRHYSALRDLKEQADEAEKILNLRIKAAEQLLLDAMEKEDLDSFKSDGYTYSLKYDLAPKVVDKQKFLAWIRKNEMEDLLGVHHQTMQGLVKEALDPDGGTGVVPEGVEVGTLTLLGRQKARA